MKRRISLLLAVVMVLGSFGAVFASSEQMTETEAGKFLEQKGILKGNTAGELELDKNMKRQDSVIMLSRLMGTEEKAQNHEVTEAVKAFADVRDNYYKGFISWAVEEELFVGHSATKFGFNEEITARDYSIVLLRALGYGEEVKGNEGWKGAFATAEKLGLLKGVEAKAEDTITRGQMSVMTVNALGTKVKGSEKTLAETLGIEMPAPTEAKVKEVRTENRKEVIVEFEAASTLNQAKLANVNSYRVAGKKVIDVKVDGNVVVLVLEKAFSSTDEKLKQELVIRDLDKKVNGKYTFDVRDNTAPTVEKVEALGEYGIKVTTSEPVVKPLERNFLIDGKNVAMEVEQYGRDIVLTPYYNVSFPEDAKTLTVGSLEDYAGFKSVTRDFDLEIVKDEVAPKAVSAVSKDGKILVTFDKDIYKKSVNKSTISYMSGRHTVESGKGVKVDTNVASFEFTNTLPKRTDITVAGVENHSKVAMEKAALGVDFVSDYTEPEIIGSKVVDLGDNNVQVELTFDKDIKDTKKSADTFFTLYKKEVKKENKVDLGDKATVVIDKKDNYKVTLTITEKLERGVAYVLEVAKFEDKNGNEMYRDYVDFKLEETGKTFEITNILVHERDNEIEIRFNKPVDRRIAEELTNYVFEMANGTKKDLEQLGGKVIVERDGKTVSLVVPDLNTKNHKKLTVSGLRDIDGNRMAKVETYVLGEVFVGLNERVEKLLGEKTVEGSAAEALDKVNAGDKDYSNKTKVVEAEENVKKAEKDLRVGKTGKDGDKEVVKADADKLEELAEKLEKEMATLDKELTKAIKEERAELKKDFDAATKAGSVDESVLGKAALVLADDKATINDIVTARENLKNAGEAADKKAAQAKVDAATVKIEEGKYVLTGEGVTFKVGETVINNGDNAPEATETEQKITVVASATVEGQTATKNFEVKIAAKPEA